MENNNDIFESDDECESINECSHQGDEIVDIDEKLKSHMLKFYETLRSNWKVWVIYQLKYAIISGHKYIVSGMLKKDEYTKGKTLFNMKKWDSIPKKYYHEKTNVLILADGWRNYIDFITNLGLSWYPVSTSNWGAELKTKYDRIYVSLENLNLDKIQ